MKRNLCKIQNFYTQENYSSSQVIQESSQPYVSFSLDDSVGFLPKHSFQISGYRYLDQALFGLPFLPDHQQVKIEDQMEIFTPKTQYTQGPSPWLKIENQSLQNLQSLQLEGTNQQMDDQANYHRGHVDFLRQLATPIFLQSRKYWKSKRKMKRGKTYYKFVAQYMKGQVSSSCKRFDQYHLQQAFINKSLREQEESEATLQAIRHLKKYKQNSGNKRLLEKHSEKYSQCRKWAIFLDKFVNPE